MKEQIENYIRKILNERLKSYCDGEYGAYQAFSMVIHDLENLIRNQKESFQCQECHKEIGKIEADYQGNKCFSHYFDEGSPEIRKIIEELYK